MLHSSRSQDQNVVDHYTLLTLTLTPSPAPTSYGSRSHLFLLHCCLKQIEDFTTSFKFQHCIYNYRSLW